MKSLPELALRKNIVAAHRKLYQAGFSVSNDGNTSVRVGSNSFLITPRGLNKALLNPAQITKVNSSGDPIQGKFKPSTELQMHLEIYRARPDVMAILHAHPVYSIALSLTNIRFDTYLPEVIIALKKIPILAYATTGTKELAQIVAKGLLDCDAVILERHGVVAVGETLEAAMSKMERVEHTAKIAAIACSLGEVTPLPAAEVERLVKLV